MGYDDGPRGGGGGYGGGGGGRGGDRDGDGPKGRVSLLCRNLPRDVRYVRWGSARGETHYGVGAG